MGRAQVPLQGLKPVLGHQHANAKHYFMLTSYSLSSFPSFLFSSQCLHCTWLKLEYEACLIKEKWLPNASIFDTS